MNEADTYRKFAVPKLEADGWDNEPHSIAEQWTFTDVRTLTRGNNATRKPAAFFNYYAPEAREILNYLSEKYATDGELQLVAVRKHLPVLKVLPIFQHGNVNEIVGKFGGSDKLRNAITEFQTLICGT